MQLDLARNEARHLLAQRLVLGVRIDVPIGERQEAGRTAWPRSPQRAQVDLHTNVRIAGHQEARRAAVAGRRAASMACTWPRWCVWCMNRRGDDMARRSRWIRPFGRSISTI